MAFTDEDFIRLNSRENTNAPEINALIRRTIAAEATIYESVESGQCANNTDSYLAWLKSKGETND